MPRQKALWRAYLLCEEGKGVSGCSGLTAHTHTHICQEIKTQKRRMPSFSESCDVDLSAATSCHECSSMGAVLTSLCIPVLDQ